MLRHPIHTIALAAVFGLAACAETGSGIAVSPNAAKEGAAVQTLLAGEVMAVAYSGFREGQHPDRGSGAVNPSREQISEDLDILLAGGFRLLRLYDAGNNSAQVLALIRERELPIKVLLGIWLDAEFSNHEGAAWLHEPIAAEQLAANLLKNEAEVERGIALAREYEDSVIAVNVGNEALVEWNDHMVPLQRVIGYVRRVKQAVGQAVTVADNYAWWVEDGAPLAAELDFIGIHTYPMWEHKSIDEALSYTIDNVEAVRAALPGKPIAILEAGWATEASEFPGQANAANQARYYREVKAWAGRNDITVFFFEAFDEPWKGNPDNAAGAEKHWGLYRVDRRPKEVMMDAVATWYERGAVAWAVNVGGAAHTAPGGIRYEADSASIGGTPGRVEGSVRGVQDDTVYRTYRGGTLAIRQALPNGSYDLTFQFMEPDDIPIGERVFDLRVQGETLIRGLDIRHVRDGNQRAGLDRSVTAVEVSGGMLAVDLVAAVGEPVLSGLVVRSRTPDRRDWELLWADEFDYEGAPDPAIWNLEVWPPRKVNDEDQAYTSRAKNVRVTGGRLVLEAHRESWRGAAYTSGRIQSQAKRDFLYGRVDIRARLPRGQGTWAALWMMPSDPFRYATSCADGGDWEGQSDCDAWPNSGEIDIMEHVGYDMGVVHGTVHNRAYYWVNQEQRKGSVVNIPVDEEFHIYSMEWTPEAIHVYCDGSPYFAYYKQDAGWRAWPYDHPYHLIFNLAIGGAWGRAGGPIDDSIFPVKVEVDYVRVYKPSAGFSAADVIDWK